MGACILPYLLLVAVLLVVVNKLQPSSATGVIFHELVGVINFDTVFTVGWDIREPRHHGRSPNEQPDRKRIATLYTNCEMVLRVKVTTRRRKRGLPPASEAFYEVSFFHACILHRDSMTALRGRGASNLIWVTFKRQLYHKTALYTESCFIQ